MSVLFQIDCYRRKTDNAHMERADDSMYQRTARSIVAMAVDHAASCVIDWHRHRRAQLLYAAQGVMLVETRSGRWVAPPTRAIWLPARSPHRIEMCGRVQVRNVYFEPSVVEDMSQECQVVAVSPLLRELIAEAARIPTSYKSESREARLMRLIVDEMRVQPVLPFFVPMPSSEPVLGIVRELLQDPSREWTLSQWGHHHGFSARTLARRFEEQCGISFGRWRQMARLQTGLMKLAEGKSVLEAALDAGYQSPSAFTKTFRRIFGCTPSLYFESAEQNAGDRILDCRLRQYQC